MHILINKVVKVAFNEIFLSSHDGFARLSSGDGYYLREDSPEGVRMPPPYMRVRHYLLIVRTIFAKIVCLREDSPPNQIFKFLEYLARKFSDIHTCSRMNVCICMLLRTESAHVFRDHV
jgi:hypothetical protein